MKIFYLIGLATLLLFSFAGTAFAGTGTIAVGDACTAFADCVPNAYCDTSDGNICKEQLFGGESCTMNLSCLGWACVGGACDCSPNANQCPNTKYCTQNIPPYCVDKLAAGEECTQPHECQSNVCSATVVSGLAMNVCAASPTPPVGTPGGPSIPAPTQYELPNFLGVDDPSVVIGKIIKYIMGFVGTIALITFMYGGILWLISGGRPAYVDKGRDTMIWSAVGMAIIFASYVLVDLVFKFFE